MSLLMASYARSGVRGGRVQVALSTLPTADRQPNDWAWYRANIKDAAAGTSYIDPHSGVRVTKLSDATTPIANTNTSHAYSEGGPMLSQVWNDTPMTITAHVTSGSTHYFVDYTRGGAATNWRIPVRNSGGHRWAFSRNPATPRFGYAIVTGTIYRLDFVDNVQVDGGIFPYTIPDQGTYGSSFGWIEITPDDHYLKFQAAGNPNDPWYFRLDLLTGALVVRYISWLGADDLGAGVSVPGAINETHMTDDGRMMWCVMSQGWGRWWDCETDLRSDLVPGASQSHSAHVKRGLISNFSGSGQWSQMLVEPPAAITVQDQEPPAKQEIGGGMGAIFGFHQSSHLRVPGGVGEQWYAGDGDGGVGLQLRSDSQITAWTLETGSIYSAGITSSSTAMADRGVTAWEFSDNIVYTPGVGSTHPLTTAIRTYRRIPLNVDLATTLASMIEGDCYWHRATQRLYIWPFGGVAPNGRIRPMNQLANHGAIHVSRVDQSERKYLCHTYSIGDAGAFTDDGWGYQGSPRPHLGPGPFLMFACDHGQRGTAETKRVDLFMVDLPIEMV